MDELRAIIGRLEIDRKDLAVLIDTKRRECEAFLAEKQRAHDALARVIAGLRAESAADAPAPAPVNEPEAQPNPFTAGTIASDCWALLEGQAKHYAELAVEIRRRSRHVSNDTVKTTLRKHARHFEQVEGGAWRRREKQ